MWKHSLRARLKKIEDLFISLYYSAGYAMLCCGFNETFVINVDNVGKLKHKKTETCNEEEKETHTR